MPTFSVHSTPNFRSLRHRSRAVLEQRIREVSSISYPAAIIPEMQEMGRDELARHLMALYRRLPA